MDQIIRLYPLLGRVGLANIETIHIDWIKTEETSFANGFAIQYSDAQAFQVISLLKAMSRLRNLTIQLNGYAFTLAYANVKHRRTYSLDKHSDFFESYRLTCAMSHYYDDKGIRVDLSTISPGSVVETPHFGNLWKTGPGYDFVAFLHINIALCDPFFEALASLRGLKTFKVKQSPHLPGGLDDQISKLLERSATAPMNTEADDDPWLHQLEQLKQISKAG